MRLISIILLIAISTATGCREKTNPEPPPPTKQKSSISTAIDGITGKTAVDAGKHAKEEIERISTKHNNELNEILGE